MKRHISIFMFPLVAVFAFGSVADLRADETIRANYVSTRGTWNAGDTMHITPKQGAIDSDRKTPVTFTAQPPAGHQVTRWLWNDDASKVGRGGESDMSEITGSDQYRKVSDDKKTCTVNYSGEGSRALGIRFDYMPLTVTFRPNGGSGTMSSITDKNIDSSFQLTANEYAKTGYSFNGWTNDLTKTYTDSATVKGGDFWNDATGKFHADLYVRWKANTYTVTFDGNGGGVPSLTSKTVTYDSTYGNLATCTREGWQFNGWFTAKSGGAKIEPTTKVTITENKTLYAQWTQKFKVTFYESTLFETSKVLKDEWVLAGGDATPPAHPVHEGYTPAGWSETYMNVRANKDVWAKYTANQYSVKFHANDGSGRTTTQPFLYGEEKKLLLDPLPCKGYVLEGWTKEKTSSTVDYKPGALVSNLATGGTVNLYALWKPISYRVEFNSNGGEGTMDSLTPKYGEPFTVPSNEFTKAGCEFKWWSAEIGGVATNFEAGAVISNLTTEAGTTVTFKAEWTGYYTVAFDANGGTGTMTNLTYETGVEYALPSNAFMKTGYRFYGWATSLADAVALKKPAYTNGQSVVDLAVPGDTRTLFAEWTTNRYTVVFNPNGGGVKGTMEPQDFLYDQEKPLSPNRFTRGELWSFAGWSNSVGRVFTNEELVSNLCADDGGIVELFARWASELGPLSEAMGCDNLKWVDGDVNNEKEGWERCETEGCDLEGQDGHPPCVMQSGPDEDGKGKRMHANIATNGMLSFWYRLSDASAWIGVYVCSAGAYSTTVGSLFGESGKWLHATFDIPFQSRQGYCIEIMHFNGGDVYIDQMTWTPEGAHPEPTPGDPVDVTAAGVEGNVFSLTIPTVSGTDYGVWTNADLTIDSWGLMGEPKPGDGNSWKVEWTILPTFPQLFFRAHKVEYK